MRSKTLHADTYYAYDTSGTITSSARKLSDASGSTWDNQCFTYDVLGELVNAWTSSAAADGKGTGCAAVSGTTWGYRTDAAPSSGPVADAPDLESDTGEPDTSLTDTLASRDRAEGRHGGHRRHRLLPVVHLRLAGQPRHPDRDGVGPAFARLGADDEPRVEHTGLDLLLGRKGKRSVAEARTFLRGYSWTTVCPAELTERLGGAEELRASGAFHSVDRGRRCPPGDRHRRGVLGGGPAPGVRGAAPGAAAGHAEARSGPP
ncbi:MULTISPECIES: hypothetical protein [unclassified Streptomyces]|uniref:hypothetical protein n=1 Tax=unclassified Streptomyces TaxID=2593676 RepID=UPI0036EFF2CC